MCTGDVFDRYCNFTISVIKVILYNCKPDEQSLCQKAKWAPVVDCLFKNQNVSHSTIENTNKHKQIKLQNCVLLARGNLIWCDKLTNE